MVISAKPRNFAPRFSLKLITMSPQEVQDLYIREAEIKEKEEKEAIETKRAWRQGMRELLAILSTEGVHCEDAPNGQGLLVYKDPTKGGYVVSMGDSRRDIFFHESLSVRFFITHEDIRLWSSPSKEEKESEDSICFRDFIIKCARTFGRVKPVENL